jgi:hypothetical protein
MLIKTGILDKNGHPKLRFSSLSLHPMAQNTTETLPARSLDPARIPSSRATLEVSRRTAEQFNTNSLLAE